MNKLQEKFPIITIVCGILSAINIMLQTVDMFQSNKLLPDNTFKITLYILSVAFFIIIVIIFLINLFMPLYIDVQIKAIKNAKKSIYICMDSLNPENSNKKLIIFDNLLQEAKKDLTVNIITRTGTERERSRGAYDMCYTHNLKDNMKFSDILNAKNLRFTLIDDEEIIISCSKGTNKGFSKKYKHFYNEKLSELLKKEFNKKWEQAVTYNKFIWNRLNELGVISKETSIKRASEMLNIPEAELINILDKTNKDSP